MRPIDLLAFKVDEHHKQFVRTYHNDEKNYKLAKRFDAYSWGHSDEYLLGYTQLNNERRYPKKIGFPSESSIKDVKVSSTHCLALSEDGTLYSWGNGVNGHLGHGDECTRVEPEAVAFNFAEDERKLRKIRK